MSSPSSEEASIRTPTPASKTLEIVLGRKQLKEEYTKLDRDANKHCFHPRSWSHLDQVSSGV